MFWQHVRTDIIGLDYINTHFEGVLHTDELGKDRNHGLWLVVHCTKALSCGMPTFFSGKESSMSGSDRDGKDDDENPCVVVEMGNSSGDDYRCPHLLI